MVVRIIRFASLSFAALLGAARAAAAQPPSPPVPAGSPCEPDEIGTIACRGDKTEYRVIRGTLSPKKRYGIAWDTGAGKTRYDYQMINGNGPYGRTAGDDTDTFLVRLTDAKMLHLLGGGHLGDAQRYNQRTIRTIWSPDENWLVILNESKWSTDNAEAYRIGADATSDPLDLLPLCAEIERRYFTTVRRKIDLEDFAQNVAVKSIGNDGNAVIGCDIQVMKREEHYRLLAKVRLYSPSVEVTDKEILQKNIGATIGPIRKCKDDEPGDCAWPEVPPE